VFVWRFDDLIYLSRPVTELAGEPRDRFLSNADRALSRSALTRAALEALAQAARRRQEADTAIRALRRLADQYPSDAQNHLRLAHLLRETGQLEDASTAYRQALATASSHR
jgi:DNA-binding SARP family transcriptional activator